jgi:hypothetical protein
MVEATSFFASVASVVTVASLVTVAVGESDIQEISATRAISAIPWDIFSVHEGDISTSDLSTRAGQAPPLH